MQISSAASAWRSTAGLLTMQRAINDMVDFEYELTPEHVVRLKKLLNSVAFQSKSQIDTAVTELIYTIAREYDGKKRQTELYQRMTTNPIPDMPAVWVGEYDRNPTELEIGSVITGGSRSGKYNSYMSAMQKWRR